MVEWGKGGGGKGKGWREGVEEESGKEKWGGGDGGRRDGKGVE